MSRVETQCKIEIYAVNGCDIETGERQLMQLTVATDPVDTDRVLVSLPNGDRVQVVAADLRLAVDRCSR